MEQTLENGLQVILKKDKRAPVVTSHIWYKIGSADEFSGKTGLSHALEHMMFKGTQNIQPGDFSKIISENGGMVNKFTGDGFLAVFGAPVKKNYEQSSNEAIKTAMEIRNAIEKLKDDLEAEGLPLIKLRIGIHSGKIITGFIFFLSK